MSLDQLLKRAEKLVIDNSPTILTSIGVTGTIMTAYFTGRASFEARDIIETYRVEEGNLNNVASDRVIIDYKTKVKLVWKEYIPAIGTGVLTIAAIIAANRIGMRRAAALAAAYSLSERAFNEYKTKVVEKIGDTRERDVRDEVAQDRVKKNPITHSEVVLTENGDVICYDSISGRYFTSNMETIRRVQNDVNARIISDYYCSLNDLYNGLGLPRTPYGEEVGWNANSLLDIQFSAVLSEEGKPVISLDYRVYPVRDYHRLQ